MRTRRLKALEIIRVIDAIGPMEPWVIETLQDEDHLVRMEAVTTLATSESAAADTALRRALQDRSPAVAEAAGRVLEKREKSCPRPPSITQRGRENNA